MTSPSTHLPVLIQDRSYDFLVQDHGPQGFDLLLFLPAPKRRLETLLRAPVRVEVARLSVQATNADELIGLALGAGYARMRLRVVHEHRNLGLGRWLLGRAFRQAAALGVGLAGELQAGQPARAQAFYERQGARIVTRAAHPRHPWVVWDPAVVRDLAG